MDGILRLQKPVRRDLILLIVGKLCMLTVLYWLFFSPAHQPAIDMTTHIAGALERASGSNALIDRVIQTYGDPAAGHHALTAR